MSDTEVVDRDEAAPGGASARRERRPRIVWLFGALALLAFLLGGVGGGFQQKLNDVAKNDNSAFLPKSAESTRAQNEANAFTTISTIPGFLVYQREGGLTADDKAKIARDLSTVRTLPGVASEQVAGPVLAKDGTAAALTVPLAAKTGGKTLTGPELSTNEQRVADVAKGGNPAGLRAHTAGVGGLLIAFIDAFQGIDGKLLLVAGIVVITLLLLIYRSPVLWFFPLFSAGLALGVASMFVYVLAKANVITLNGQSQGILSVLVIGAGTDYALLLISRYREELHNYPSRVQAMMRAWRGAAPAIVASGATVMIGLLCLLVSELNSNRGLGPVAAIGIACTVFVMLTFLPVVLVLVGRWIFWPRIPHLDHASDIASHGVWGRIAAAIGARYRRNWITTAAVLLVLVALVPTLRVKGLSISDSFTNNPDAVVGQRIYDAKFDRGAGAPAVIVTNAEKADEVIAAAMRVRGVDQKPGSVCLQPDYAKLADLAKAGGAGAAGGAMPKPGAGAASGAGAPSGGLAGGASPGCLPPALTVQPRGGRTVVNATLTSAFDSSDAYASVKALRKAVHAIPGANAVVGGQSAINLDTKQASVRDRNVIIPLVLLVILVVLMLLLRALVAPVLLIATVVLSFLATLGVCAMFFNHVFHFVGADPSFPLFAFIFLVALGIDYNIFLMTRVREETLSYGTRTGITRGLAVTGGVITSAGMVLAATFAVLGVLPLVFLAELGFAVAFGVLLDTILVRSILVPALGFEIGPRIWWPGRLADEQARPATAPAEARPGVGG